LLALLDARVGGAFGQEFRLIETTNLVLLERVRDRQSKLGEALVRQRQRLTFYRNDEGRDNHDSCLVASSLQ